MTKEKGTKLPIAAIVSATFLAIALIIFIGAYSEKEAFSKINLWGAKETEIESRNKDTDQDGLKDWEENLYDTDPTNPDTDGDGYLDGEEIDSGHNPTVKGPGDQLAFYPLPLGEKYNITQRVFTDSEKIIKNYLIQKSQFLEDHPEINSPEEFLAQIDQTTLNELFKRAILENQKDWAERAEKILEESPEIFEIQVSDQDIYISEDNSAENKQKYLSKLSEYINSQDFFLQERSFLLLKNDLPQNKFTDLENLIKENERQIRRLRETEVPSSLKEIHKKVLKISITLRNIFISAIDYDSDPMKAVIGLNKAKDAIKLWEALSPQIQKAAEENNVEI
ncbi:MAG: hypothetical protein GF387_02820 [Candidatus Portnoybacteria bacterium]|nr:hypothetical protein [Candidatus Portnoybacteria bacterium]